MPVLPSIFNETQWVLEPAVPDPAQFNDEIILTHRKGIETVRTMVYTGRTRAHIHIHKHNTQKLGLLIDIHKYYKYYLVIRNLYPT